MLPAWFEEKIKNKETGAQQNEHVKGYCIINEEPVAGY